MESIISALSIDQNLSQCSFAVAMEEVQQNSNGSESQTVAIPTTITASHLSQIAQVLLMCLCKHFFMVYKNVVWLHIC